MVIFQYNYTFLGFIFELCYIQNHVITNSVTKEVVVYLFEKLLMNTHKRSTLLWPL